VTTTYGDVDRVARLAAGATDLVAFWRAAGEVIGSRVPHYWAPCWFTLDPESLLMTSHFHDGLEEFPAAWLEAEYLTDDLHQLASVARSDLPVSTLHELTGGDPTGTPRWQANMELGGDQELLLPLRSGRRETFGVLGLYREPGAPVFSAAEKHFLSTLAPHLAAGVRRALLAGEAADPDYGDAPVALVLDPAGELVSATPGADVLLATLPGGEGGSLPTAVRAVAAAAREDGGGAQVRVRGRDRRWVTIHGGALGTGTSVVLEVAHPGRLQTLLMALHDLTARERDVTGLVLEGCSTREIAARLVLSEHTVQQHLKAVFEKVGVRSRRDLVARVFFRHYEPRVRDNEGRVGRGLGVRGGPVASSGGG
jgi:DNA-binding CsgD family transcriptional regulator